MSAPSTAGIPAVVEAAPASKPALVEPPPAGDWLATELAEWAGTPRTLIVSIPAPVVEPEALLDASSRRLGFVWDPPDGLAVAGVGAAHRIQLEGADRFARLRARAAEVFERIRTRSHPACPMVSSRLYGGLAFDVGAAGAEPWQELGDGCFTLPRIGYASDGERASLSLAVRGEEIASMTAQLAWISELDAVCSLLTSRRRTGAPAPARSAVLAVERPSRRVWRAAIESIRRDIAAGACQKIVAAGHSRVELPVALGTSAVLRRLSRGLKASTRFAFCRRHSTFLGATPERLITRRGASIVTEALAGSIAPGGEGAERLLHSGKDLVEHQLVVDQIVRRLEPLCDRLEVGSRPRVRELREVLHLLTPITGSLSRPRHVLELVEQLHPTPAVGGVPTETAMRWIREHEPAGRGWYAAPVGWFDAAGDGDFAVALRSCVLRDSQAFLYAGAGIVRDSDPDLEYTETELKKQALLRALGA